MSTTYFTATPEQKARARCKATWEAGDFGVVAKYIEPAAAEFMGRLPLRPGMRVIDVACGTGNLAALAARSGCVTCGVDIATNLIAKARARAAAEKLQIEFREGDAESLFFADQQFDAVVSMFGVMFAANPDRAEAELIRVCRPGGVIALANWTEEGLIGEHFRVVAKYLPPPTCCVSPLLWGNEAMVRERMGSRVGDLQLNRRVAKLHYPFTPAQTVEFFRQFYGPTLRAFTALPQEAQSALRADLETMFVQHNRATDGTTEVHAEYLEVVAVR